MNIKKELAKLGFEMDKMYYGDWEWGPEVIIGSKKYRIMMQHDRFGVPLPGGGTIALRMIESVCCDVTVPEENDPSLEPSLPYLLEEARISKFRTDQKARMAAFDIAEKAFTLELTNQMASIFAFKENQLKLSKEKRENTIKNPIDIIKLMLRDRYSLSQKVEIDAAMFRISFSEQNSAITIHVQYRHPVDTHYLKGNIVGAFELTDPEFENKFVKKIDDLLNAAETLGCEKGVGRIGEHK